MNGFDAAADRMLDPLRRSRRFTRAMVHVTNSAVYSIVWLVVSLLGALLDGTHRSTWLLIAVGVVGEFALTNGPVKQIFRRQRPVDPLAGEWVEGLRRPKTSSFPSGHASASGFMAAATLGLAGWPFVIALGLVISLSRVFLRVHHASDILAGLAWGALVGLAWRALVL